MRFQYCFYINSQNIFKYSFSIYKTCNTELNEFLNDFWATCPVPLPSVTHIFELDLVVYGLRLHVQMGKEKVRLSSKTCDDETKAAEHVDRWPAPCMADGVHSHRSVVNGVIQRARLAVLKMRRFHKDTIRVNVGKNVHFTPPWRPRVQEYSRF